MALRLRLVFLSFRDTTYRRQSRRGLACVQLSRKKEADWADVEGRAGDVVFSIRRRHVES
jgi:hypothetical protein